MFNTVRDELVSTLLYLLGNADDAQDATPATRVSLRATFVLEAQRRGAAAVILLPADLEYPRRASAASLRLVPTTGTTAPPWTPVATIPVLAAEPAFQHTTRIYLENNITRFSPLFVPLVALGGGLAFALLSLACVAVATGYVAWAIVRDGVAHRLDGEDLVSSEGVGTEAAAQVHLGLGRVLDVVHPGG